MSTGAIPEMQPRPTPGSEKSPAIYFFHMTIILGWVPFIAVPAHLICTLLNYSHPSRESEHFLWRRRLLLLLAADVLVSAALIVLLVYSKKVVPPEAPKVSEKAAARELFEPVPGLPGKEFSTDGALPFVPAMLLALLLWTRARWKKAPKVILWSGYFSVLIGAILASYGLAYLLREWQGGISTGAVLLSLFAHGAVLSALSLLVLRWGMVPQLDLKPKYSTPGTILRGSYYIISGLPRVAYILVALNLLFFSGGLGGEQPLAAFTKMNLGVPGYAILIVTTTLLAPIGEELLFRGYLLPRLSIQFNPFWGVVLSALVFSIMHPHYSLFVGIVFFYGLVLGWARLRSGGLAAPMVLHFLINGVATGMMFLTQS